MMKKNYLLKTLLVLIISLFGFGGLKAQNCQADFYYYKSSAPLTYTFVDTSTYSGSLIAGEWDFDDPASTNTTNNGTSATHTFSGPGTYNVRLIIKTSSLCVDTAYRLVTAGNEAPIAFDDTYLVEMNQQSILQPALNDYDQDGFIDSVMITNQARFGNITYSGNNVLIYHPDQNFVGTDTFTYMVFDNEGAMSNEATGYLYVDSLGNAQDSCWASYSRTQFDMNEIYFYAHTGTANPSYSWDFGDGSTSTEQNPVHTYNQSGQYNACLTVTDSVSGCQAVYCSFIVVDNSSDSCFASFMYYPYQDTSGSNGYTVAFYDNSPSWSNQWFWDFGDGTTSTEHYPVHTYAQHGTYNVCFTITNSFCSDTYCDTVVVERPKAYISGMVYRDSNGNGQWDQPEPGLDGRVVEIWPGPIYVTTTYGGYYWATVDSGLYMIQTQVPSGWEQTAPKSPNSYTINADWGKYYSGLDFGQKPDANTQDLEVHITNWNGARPGFTSMYRIDYINMGGKAMSGTVTFDHDPDLTFNTSTPATSSYSAASSQATWNFTNLQPGEKGYIDIYMDVNVNQPLGDTLYNYASIVPLSGDATPENNWDSALVEVRGSYDPNDKAVQPAGLTEQGYIAKDQELTYTIRFQNTGNAEAINIRVEDELDADLDLSTLNVISASHSYVFDLINSNKLIWYFNNVNLPDSFSNEPESHGFIKYSIKPKATVIDGDRIHNTAYIYFDFNPAVITNTTVNTFGNPTGIGNHELITMELSPNPVHSTAVLKLNGSSKNGYSIRILDVTGREVRMMKDIKTTSATISREGLENGMYFIEVSSDNKVLGNTKFVVH